MTKTYTEYDWDKKETPVFDKLIAEFKGLPQTSADILLLQLLTWNKEVAPWFESCLPQYNEYFKALDYENPSEYTGYTFHKGFRQIGIVDDEGAGTNSKIWGLLSETQTFWNALDTVLNGEK
jgi:hypothetical protein